MFWVSWLRTASYGVRLVWWDFWAWKTKNTMWESYLWKKENPNWIIISNIKYDFVDIHFDDEHDLEVLLKYLSLYIKQTNDPISRKADNYRPLLVIVDEAHIYYFARNFKGNIMKDTIIFNTQCRKRNIVISYITQEMAQIDVFMRRLSPNVTWYRRYMFFFTIAMDLYYKISEATDIWDEYNVEVRNRYIIYPDRLNKLINKQSRINFTNQKDQTKYVVWYDKKFTLTYDQFLEIILPPKNDTQLLDTPKPTQPNLLQRITRTIWTNQYTNKIKHIFTRILNYL